ENVYDFSIGNPNVPAPAAIQEAIVDIVQTMSPVEYHSYTASPGRHSTRDAIAKNLNRRFGTSYDANDVYMTSGASASLTITLKAILASPEEEVVVVAPFFPEYRYYVE